MASGPPGGAPPPHPPTLDLPGWFGGIDVYLFDQLLRGRLPAGTRVLDAGCGAGRNLVYFLRSGYDVHGLDASFEAVEAVRVLAARLAPRLSEDNFRVGDVARLPYEGSAFDAVLANAVLHFADSEEHFHRMVDELWRVLRPGGLFFARLAATVGHEEQHRPVGGRRFVQPDGDERFLVDEELLRATTERLRGEWADPLKTVVVHGQRAMSVWSLRKPAA